MFLEVRIPKELVNWHTEQNEQIKSKATRKTDVWGTSRKFTSKIQKQSQKTPP